jgi:hypothetical protein
VLLDDRGVNRIASWFARGSPALWTELQLRWYFRDGREFSSL